MTSTQYLAIAVVSLAAGQLIQLALIISLYRKTREP